MKTRSKDTANAESAIAFRQDLPKLDVSTEELAKFKKTTAGINRVARENSKPEFCYICGSFMPKFCNSHTIPKYCLKEIAHEGKLYTASVLTEINLSKAEVGVNEAAIFKRVCRKCDTEYFKVYETPSTLTQAPTDRIMGQIAAKNLLREISKARYSIAQKEALGNNCPPKLDLITRVKKIDLEEDESAFKTAVRVGNNPNSSSAYHLMFHKVLPYVTPFAFQQMISPIADFEGGLINNCFSPNPKLRMESIHICVLPSKGNTSIIMFRGEKAKRYRGFEKQLKNRSKEDQLEAIVKLIFAYSEEVFISKKIDPTVLANSDLKALACINQNYEGYGNSCAAFNREALMAAIRDFSLNNLPKPPLLLSKAYAI